MNNKLSIYFVVILAIYIASILSMFVFGGTKSLPEDISSNWNAVFLSDGQVYFGHLEDENRNFTKLSDVYYLKYGNKLQQDVSGNDNSSQNINLVKLGGEVHGPNGVMYIAKDKILFIENLKETSTVVQTISKSR